MQQELHSYPRNSPEYYLANKERIRAQQKLYYQNNKEKCRVISERWRKENPDKVAALRRARLIRVPHDVRAAKSAYKRRCRVQMPLWADKSAIKEIYKQASQRSLTVDHIIPLKGKTVCGLHVESNLQLLTKSENSSKHNKF